MALIPKVEPKQEKKVVSAASTRKRTRCFSAMLPFSRRNARIHHRRIVEADLFRRYKEFNQWLEMNLRTLDCNF